MSWDSISCWIEHHPGLASWVQAIGSIGAIMVAIWISGGERRHILKIQKVARRDAIARAVDASAHAKATAQLCSDAFRLGRPQRTEMPRYLAAVEHAIARVKDVSAGPGIDSEVQGHLYEVSSTLIDVKELVDQYVKGTHGLAVVQGGLLRQNVERIDKSLNGLRSVRN